MAEGVELWGSGEVPGERQPYLTQFVCETDTLSRSVYEPICMHILGGGLSPIWERGLSYRVWYLVKVCNIRYNFAVYEPIAIQVMRGGLSSNCLGRGVITR
jgi:hypothetical protein